MISRFQKVGYESLVIDRAALCLSSFAYQII